MIPQSVRQEGRTPPPHPVLRGGGGCQRALSGLVGSPSEETAFRRTHTPNRNSKSMESVSPLTSGTARESEGEDVSLSYAHPTFHSRGLQRVGVSVFPPASGSDLSSLSGGGGRTMSTLHWVSL